MPGWWACMAGPKHGAQALAWLTGRAVIVQSGHGCTGGDPHVPCCPRAVFTSVRSSHKTWEDGRIH